jgi:hypothetical protein
MVGRARLSILLLAAGLTMDCAAPRPHAALASRPRPQASAAPQAPAAPGVVQRVDGTLRAAWQQKSITPAEVASDEVFLRRATLDLTGTLPAPDAVIAFLGDGRPDKRSRLIDSLLADERFARRWAAVWTDVLLGDDRANNGVDRAAFTAWLRGRFAEGAPWDEMVRAMVSGTGVASPGGSRRERMMAAASGAPEEEDPDVNGEVNYLLRYRGAIEDLAGKTSRAFLGIQIQCAQCHDHKTEPWTTDQFRHFAAAFARTRALPVERADKGEMRVFEVRDVKRAKAGKKASPAERAISEMAPVALDGTALDAESPRKALAAWITRPESPTFARAFVNRTWASLLGRGFVEPVDDLRASNPPAAPEALDALAADFVASGFDVKHLVRTICATEAYGRAAGPVTDLWASFAPRALPADVMFDALLSATELGPLIEEAAGERADEIRARARQRFAFVLDVDEDADPTRFEGSIAQALLLSNGAVTRVGASAVDGGALARILEMEGDEAKIRALYLRTLSRRPTREEVSRWRHFLDEADARGPSPAVPPPLPGKIDPVGRLARRLRSTADTAREQAYEDLFWALLNSSEMGLQH